jgi:hypothetical protein
MFKFDPRWLSVALPLFLTVPGASAQDSAAAFPMPAGGIVRICEVPPDFYAGNCPPTVSQNFDAGVTNEAVGEVAVALAERLQQAEAENDLGLCIDLAEGILQASTFATDQAQRAAVRELAQSSCCVRVEGASYGQLLGGAVALPLVGKEQDGAVTQGALTFSAADASFVADGVRQGDILVITSGDQQGFYVIGAAVGPTELSLAQTEAVNFPGWAKTEAGLHFEIRRPALAENSCQPGVQTAAITLVPVPASAN